MTIAKHFLGVAALSGVLMLTACSANFQYSVLNRDAKSADALPASVVESDAEIDFSSSRFVGVDAGVSLWLVAPKAPYGICLVTNKEDQDWSVACSGGALGVDMGPGHNYWVYPDGMPNREGMRRISENVFALTD